MHTICVLTYSKCHDSNTKHQNRNILPWPASLFWYCMAFWRGLWITNHFLCLNLEMHVHFRLEDLFRACYNSCTFCASYKYSELSLIAFYYFLNLQKNHFRFKLLTFYVSVYNIPRNFNLLVTQVNNNGYIMIP